MLRLRALCFALMTSLALNALGAAAASAQDAPAPTAAPAVDAREAFRRGEAAYSAGNYEMAIREWTNAYAADPRPRIQFNLSQAYERTGELEKAMAALKKFLESADPDDPMYSDANARLSALQQRIASTGVLVRGGAEGGLITVDEQDWGRTPRPDKITLSPGSHTIIVRWTGAPEFRTSVFVPAGQVVEVQLPADAGKGGAAPASTSDGFATRGSVSTGSPMKQKLRWIVPGAALAAAGTGLLIYGIVRNGDVVDCGGNTYCPNPDDSDAAKAQSMVGLVGGPLLLAGGASLILVGLLRDDGAEQQAKTQCGVGLASATCRFRF